MVTTIDELARLSGVSRATVSRVINGGPVSAKTRRRVEHVLEETGYRPNRAARTLATGRSGVVGVVMHVDADRLFRDAYFGQLLQGINDVLGERSEGMMLWLGGRTKEETLEGILSSGLADGVIALAHAVDDVLVDGLLASDLPTVLVGHRRQDRSASYVDVENVYAADAMTSHLLRLGRTRVGHVTGIRGNVAAEDRIAGYLRAMERAGLAAGDLVVDGAYDGASGASGASILLDRGCDAIFCANDAMAAGALETIRARGLAVPGDVALAGFDDLEFAARLDPPLTTVRQGVREQGAEAVRLLLELLSDRGGPPRRVILPTELVVRESTAGAALRP